MSDTVISVEHVSKLYKLGLIGGGTLRDDLSRWWAKLRGKPDPLLKIGQEDHGNREGEYIWALRDVSFEVKQGEVLGIIGRNGAGKSTLLKILSQITAPTSGQVKVKGRIASLLEVGTGFHPELTGRENIYLNGAILGMTKAEVTRKLDEIVAFAEVDRFIDTPVKRYSSGMYVRLAFAVAAHLDPEILLVDEVLAVGDAAFQQKCLGKMGDVARGGRTVLFVSHNMGAIRRLCRRAIRLSRGRLVADGCSDAVLTAYAGEGTTIRPEWTRSGSPNGISAVTIERVAVAGPDGILTGPAPGDQPIHLHIEYTVKRYVTACQIGFRIYNAEGTAVLTSGDADAEDSAALPKPPGRYRATATLPGRFLVPGTYTLLIAAHMPGRTTYDVVDGVVAFAVSPAGALTTLDGRLGVVAPLLRWSTEMEAAICT